MTETTSAPDSPENPHAGRGVGVVLDIGGDHGALVVIMPMSMVGQEVDIAPEGHEQDGASEVDHDHQDDHGHGHGHGHGHRDHVAVIRRTTFAGTVTPSLVYPSLLEGRYSLLLKGTDEVVMVAEVRGAEVTEATWPA